MQSRMQQGKLVLENGVVFNGISAGYSQSCAGEVVFTTGMVGYTESLTDPSYAGQILVFTFPLIGNYGVPFKTYWESEKIQTTGVIMSSLINNNTHYQCEKILRDWFIQEKIPALEIKDTRSLTQIIRTRGSLLGKIIFDKNIPSIDPNKENLVDRVSIKKQKIYEKGTLTIGLIDCGVKMGIVQSLINRNIKIIQLPWDYDIVFEKIHVDGVIISNGPGDPKILYKTIQNVQKLIHKNIPILGICLGNQILALSAGGDTKKMKFGHRSQNQPCRIDDGSNRYFLTTQNHSFVVSKIPKGFVSWFTNANDGTNEGIIHKTKPFMSVQFHPEGRPGPTDTEWVFDYFINQLKITN